MPFGLVDDKLHSSIKWRMATKGGRALWSTALSWCMDQLTDGHVPKGMLRVLDGSTADARSLVTVGLWEPADDGWRFHDWLDYQPDAASIRAKREKESVGGLRGNHERWHAKRGLVVEGCEFCSSGDGSGTRSGTRSGQGLGGESSPTPAPTQYPSPTKARDSGTPRNAHENEPPDAHPQPEFQNVQAVLASMGMSENDRREFLIHLRRNKADNPAAVVSKLHRNGKLAARIDEWRLMADVDAEAASRPAKSTRVAAHADLVQQFAAQEAAGNVVPIRQIEGA